MTLNNRLWMGRYLDGRDASTKDVKVRVTQSGLKLSGDGLTTVWPFSEIRQTQGFTSEEHVRFERGEEPAEALVVEDQEILDAFPWTPSTEQFDRRETRNRLFYGAAVLLVLVVGLLTLAYFWVLPPLAEKIVDSVPVAWEVQLGEIVLSVLAPKDASLEDPALAPLGRILQLLASERPLSDYDFSLTVVEEDAVNAFAVPGGRIVLFTGLVAAADSPDEIAGVLAHEVQHVLMRHGTKALFRELAWSVVWGTLAGDAEVMSNVLEGAGQLAGLSYRRDDEIEADREGIALIMKARINPNGMIQFFEKLEDASEWSPAQLTYLSTHPRATDRVDVLKRMASVTSYRPIELMSDDEWYQLKAVCE